MDLLREQTRRVRLGLVSIGIGIGLFELTRRVIDFEKSMSAVAAITLTVGTSFQRMRDIVGVTRLQFDALRETAQDLGATTVFTASEAANAMKLLAQAGFTATEAMEAVPGTLDLAVAGAVDLTTAAGLVASNVRAFGLEAGEATRVADIFATTVTRTNVNVVTLGDALKFFAPVARAAGIELEEAAVAVGLLGNAGIRGTIAGTALRRSISGLLAQTPQATDALRSLGLTAADIDPRFNSLSDVLRKFGEAGLDAARAFDLFDLRGGPAILVLSRMTDRFDELLAQVRANEGAARRMARIMRDNLAGDLRILTSVIQDAVLRLGGSGEDSLLGSMRSVTQTTADVIRVLSGVENAASETAQRVRTLVVAVEALAEAFKVFLFFAITNFFLGPILAAGSAVARATTLFGKFRAVLTTAGIARTAAGVTGLAVATGKLGDTLASTRRGIEQSNQRLIQHRRILEQIMGIEGIEEQEKALARLIQARGRFRDVVGDVPGRGLLADVEAAFGPREFDVVATFREEGADELIRKLREITGGEMQRLNEELRRLQLEGPGALETLTQVFIELGNAIRAIKPLMAELADFLTRGLPGPVRAFGEAVFRIVTFSSRQPIEFLQRRATERLTEDIKAEQERLLSQGAERIEQVVEGIRFQLNIEEFAKQLRDAGVDVDALGESLVNLGQDAQRVADEMRDAFRDATSQIGVEARTFGLQDVFGLTGTAQAQAAAAEQGRIERRLAGLRDSLELQQQALVVQLEISKQARGREDETLFTPEESEAIAKRIAGLRDVSDSTKAAIAQVESSSTANIEAAKVLADLQERQRQVNQVFSAAAPPALQLNQLQASRSRIEGDLIAALKNTAEANQQAVDEDKNRALASSAAARFISQETAQILESTVAFERQGETIAQQVQRFQEFRRAAGGLAFDVAEAFSRGFEQPAQRARRQVTELIERVSDVTAITELEQAAARAESNFDSFVDTMARFIQQNEAGVSADEARVRSQGLLELAILRTKRAAEEARLALVRELEEAARFPAKAQQEIMRATAFQRPGGRFGFEEAFGRGFETAGQRRERLEGEFARGAPEQLRGILEQSEQLEDVTANLDKYRETVARVLVQQGLLTDGALANAEAQKVVSVAVNELEADLLDQTVAYLRLGNRVQESTARFRAFIDTQGDLRFTAAEAATQGFTTALKQQQEAIDSLISSASDIAGFEALGQAIQTVEGDMDAFAETIGNTLVALGRAQDAAEGAAKAHELLTVAVIRGKAEVARFILTLRDEREELLRLNDTLAQSKQRIEALEQLGPGFAFGFVEEITDGFETAAQQMERIGGDVARGLEDALTVAVTKPFGPEGRQAFVQFFEQLQEMFVREFVVKPLLKEVSEALFGVDLSSTAQEKQLSVNEEQLEVLRNIDDRLARALNQDLTPRNPIGDIRQGRVGGLLGFLFGKEPGLSQEELNRIPEGQLDRQVGDLAPTLELGRERSSLFDCCKNQSDHLEVIRQQLPTRASEATVSAELERANGELGALNAQTAANGAAATANAAANAAVTAGVGGAVDRNTAANVLGTVTRGRELRGIHEELKRIHDALLKRVREENEVMEKALEDLRTSNEPLIERARENERQRQQREREAIQQDRGELEIQVDPMSSTVPPPPSVQDILREQGRLEDISTPPINPAGETREIEIRLDSLRDAVDRLGEFIPDEIRQGVTWLTSVLNNGFGGNFRILTQLLTAIQLGGAGGSGGDLSGLLGMFGGGGGLGGLGGLFGGGGSGTAAGLAEFNELLAGATAAAPLPLALGGVTGSRNRTLAMLHADEMVAPLRNGRLPVTLDEELGARVELPSGVSVPVDFSGANPMIGLLQGIAGGQQQGGGGSGGEKENPSVLQVVMNIQTPDADSFRRSGSQIRGELSKMLSRETRRG